MRQFKGYFGRIAKFLRFSRPPILIFCLDLSLQKKFQQKKKLMTKNDPENIATEMDDLLANQNAGKCGSQSEYKD